jgi:protein-S-isoprenylcysteine O-methyltransferase
MTSVDTTAGPPAPSSRPTSSASGSSASSASSAAAEAERSAPTVLLADLAPAGKISLTAISLESYVLGALLGAGASWTIYFAFLAASEPLTRFWRPPLFAALLALFHFAEFYVYARWNLPHARRDSFLTRSNGGHYGYAMALAMLETIVAGRFFPRWQDFWSPPWLRLAGALLVAGGQALRHGAIATAGTSFHHLLQRDLRPGHVLVTTGPYAVLRHPSYFGFYWWAVGTQVLLGNPLSAAMFAGVLWHFFYRRTVGECAFLGFASAFCFGSRPVRKPRATREIMWAR